MIVSKYADHLPLNRLSKIFARDGLSFFETREGWIQADAYKGYDKIYDRPGSRAVEVGCWAHSRRYFVEAKDGGDARPIVRLMATARARCR